MLALMPFLFPKMQAKMMAKKTGRKMQKFAGYDFDDMLDAVGLKKNNTGATIASGVGILLGGIAVGAVLGVLFAPRSGKELRKTITEEGWTGLKELGKGAMDKATNATERTAKALS
jgi:hypothetical protein